MKLNELPKITHRSKKRLGQGLGSGRGKTAGKGVKGQRARGKIKPLFEGASWQASFIKHLPLLRGKGKNKPLRKQPFGINLKYLNLLPANTEVDIETLIKAKIVDKKAREIGIKILGDGNIKIPLIIKLPCSGGARAKIEKAGGKIV